jgi:hypothetical protein
MLGVYGGLGTWGVNVILPIILIDGGNYLNVPKYSQYTEPSYTGQTVDTSLLGEYIQYLNYTDNNGRVAQTVIYTVTVVNIEYIRIKQLKITIQ